MLSSTYFQCCVSDDSLVSVQTMISSYWKYNYSDSFCVSFILMDHSILTFLININSSSSSQNSFPTHYQSMQNYCDQIIRTLLRVIFIILLLLTFQQISSKTKIACWFVYANVLWLFISEKIVIWLLRYSHRCWQSLLYILSKVMQIKMFRLSDDLIASSAS